MDEDSARNATVAALAEHLYGRRPRISKLYSENNYVCRLDFNGIQPRVLKLAGAEHLATAVRQEATVLTRLAHTGMAVPELEHSGEWEGVPYLAMEFVTADSLASGMAAGAAWAPAACFQAGAFLSRLHQLPLALIEDVEPQHYPVTRRLSWQHWTLREAWDAADGDLQEMLQRSAERLNRALSEPPVAIVHDSFIATHVLTDGSGAFAVNDWETIRAGYLERDIACFIAAANSWGGGTATHVSSFVEGYGATPGAIDQQRVVDWQISYLMNWAAFSLRHGRQAMADELLVAIRALVLQ